MTAKKFWPPARARRKGGVGGIPPRPSVPPDRSGGAVSSVQKMFEQSCIIPQIKFGQVSPENLSMQAGRGFARPSESVANRRTEKEGIPLGPQKKLFDGK